MPEPKVLILQVPMRETAKVAVGEKLTIEFTKDCCFCCADDQVNNFDPPLPIGDHKKGDTWVGTANTAGTIDFHHDPYGSGSKKNHDSSGGGTRSIQVGD
jgi:hypothetical protein